MVRQVHEHLDPSFATTASSSGENGVRGDRFP